MQQQFRDELQTLTDIPNDDESGDVTAPHIRSDRDGLEGQNILEMCSLNGWMIANTYF